MSEPGIDVEQLAALIDGRLDAREREEVLARLAQANDDFELFADTLEATRALELEEAAEGTVPLVSRRTAGWSIPALRWGALAAALVGVSLVGTLLVQPRGDRNGDPSRFAALLAAEAGSLPAAVLERPWAPVRARSDALTPDARAARLGAALVDLEVAVRSRDPHTAEVSDEVVTLLEGVPAAGPVTEKYRDIASRAGAAPKELTSLLEEGRESVARMVDGDRFRLGAWAEAGRIAAARRDAAFFQAHESRAALQRATELPTLEPAARSAIARISSALAVGGTPDWDVLQRDLANLLRALGDAGLRQPFPEHGPDQAS